METILCTSSIILFSNIKFIYLNIILFHVRIRAETDSEFTIQIRAKTNILNVNEK